jgi:hypothetical protein
MYKVGLRSRLKLIAVLIVISFILHAVVLLLPSSPDVGRFALIGLGADGMTLTFLFAMLYTSSELGGM